jgi:hypothetical protein
MLSLLLVLILHIIFPPHERSEDDLIKKRVSNSLKSSKVLYMSFDKFLLAFESRDLSQVLRQEYHKSVFFPKAE